MANVITLAMLIENEACEKQVKSFKKYFGDSVEITEEVSLKYYEEFDVGWLVDNMLNDEQKEAYEAIEGFAMAAYKAIEGLAWESYEAIYGPAWEAYEASVGPAYKAYLAIHEEAYESYKKEQARAFYIAYNS